MTQMSSVWPIGTSVTDFSAVYKRAQVVLNGDLGICCFVVLELFSVVSLVMLMGIAKWNGAIHM